MTAVQQVTAASLFAIVVCGSLVDARAEDPRFLETTSPDGSLVAFVSKVKQGDTKIFVERSDGTHRVQLTRDAYSDTNPNWSPDGKRIAFQSNRAGKWQIFVMNADGTAVRRLSDDAAAQSEGAPNWSPDGKRIAFVSDRSGKWQIYAVDPDGTEVETLTQDETGAMRPKYAPDGRMGYLAEREKAGKTPLYDLVILDGGRHSTLRAKSPIKDFAWCQNGQTIAYGVGSEIVFHDFRKNSDLSVSLIDIDKRLDSHAAFDLLWKPTENVLSCRLRFMGGIPEGLVLFGDNQFVTVSPDGVARLLERGEQR